MLTYALFAIGLCTALSGCRADAPAAPTEVPGGVTMKLTSTAFAEGESIPRQYTCDGEDISPPVVWSDAPAGTTTFALIADDPDSPVGTWVHWVLFDLPGDLTDLPEAVPKVVQPPTGGVHGNNSWGRADYGGPCPPGGAHRYLFKLYALNTDLGLDPGASAADVQAAMEGHVLAQTQLMGRFAR